MCLHNSPLSFLSFLTLNLLIDQRQETAEVHYLDGWILLLEEINISERTIMNGTEEDYTQYILQFIKQRRHANMAWHDMT